MKITPQTKPIDVNVTFSPNDYFVIKNKNEHQEESPYALAIRLDMSYAGKPDQVGATILYLEEEEAKVFRDAGFHYIKDIK